MRRVTLPVILCLFVSISSAEYATQTDWSGGAGVPGPVPEWGDTYDTSCSIDNPVGLLALTQHALSNPVKTFVDTHFPYPRSVYAEDVDGDGDIDVLGAAEGPGDISWWENSDGTGTSWTEHLVDGGFSGAYSVYATDVDDDDDIDVLGAAIYADEISWWENTDGVGTSWTKHIVGWNCSGAASVYATDVDGDGDIDVIGSAAFDGEIIWWENFDGIGITWIKHTIDENSNDCRSVYSADVDGDGDADVLGAVTDNNEIIWWENSDGIGSVWIGHQIDGDVRWASSVYACDVDGDADIDVLGTASNAHDVIWWENTDGAGTVWIKHLVDGDFGLPNSVYATDVDGDGDIDVLAAASAVYVNMSWWENTNSIGTSWTEHPIDKDFPQATSVYASDIDGDGDTDVLGASLYDHDVAWWSVIGYAEEGILESSILDAGNVDIWELFESSYQLPPSTSIGFQFRSSSDPGNMGVWSDTIFSDYTPLQGILVDSTRYLQYRTILLSSYALNSPTLEEIAFSYSTCTGINESSSGGDEFPALSPASNPCHNHLALRICVLEPALVELQVFDITGRVVARIQEELQEGLHVLYFYELGSGVYTCVMRSGDLMVPVRVVLLR